MTNHEKYHSPKLTEEGLTARDFQGLYRDLITYYGKDEAITAEIKSQETGLEVTFISFDHAHQTLEFARALFADETRVVKAVKAAQDTTDLSRFLINYAPGAPRLTRLFEDGGYDVRLLKEGTQRPEPQELYWELDDLLER